MNTYASCGPPAWRKGKRLQNRDQSSQNQHHQQRGGGGLDVNSLIAMAQKAFSIYLGGGNIVGQLNKMVQVAGLGNGGGGGRNNGSGNGGGGGRNNKQGGGSTRQQRRARANKAKGWGSSQSSGGGSNSQQSQQSQQTSSTASTKTSSGGSGWITYSGQWHHNNGKWHWTPPAGDTPQPAAPTTAPAPNRGWENAAKKSGGANDEKLPLWQCWLARGDDVDAPLWTVKQLADTIAAKVSSEHDESAAVIRCAIQVDDDTCDKARTLANMGPNIHVLLIRPIHSGSVVTDDEWRNELPGRAGEGGPSRLCKVALWSKGPLAPKVNMTKKQSKHQAAADSSIVLRMSAEMKYAPETWKSVLSKAGKSARGWARNLLPEDLLPKLRDTFNWFVNDGDEKTLVWGLWRMEPEAASELVHHSGQQCENGFRFYADPMKWGEQGFPLTTTDYRTCKRQNVSQNEDKIVLESWSDFADRVYAQSGDFGAALGERTVGPRAKRDSSITETSKNWRIEKVPAFFVHADVKAICVEMGLKDIEFGDSHGWTVAPKVPGSTIARKTWHVRATTPIASTSFTSQYDHGGEVVETSEQSSNWFWDFC